MANKQAGIVLFDVQQAALISRESHGFDQMSEPSWCV